MRQTWLWLVSTCLFASAVVAGLWLSGNGNKAAPDPDWLQDVTDEVGLDFVHDAGPVGEYFMPQIMGSGAAFLDFDNDGLLDIYLIQNGGPDGSTNRLYRQTPDHRFVDVSKGSGLDVAGYGMGVAGGGREKQRGGGVGGHPVWP